MKPIKFVEYPTVVHANTPQESYFKEATFEDIYEMYKDEMILLDKRKAPLVIFKTLKNPKATKENQNIASHTALVYDFDSLTSEDLQEQIETEELKSLEICYWYYPTFSYFEGKHIGARLIIPLQEEITDNDTYVKVLREFQILAGIETLENDKHVETPSQGMFIPCKPHNTVRETQQVCYLDGEYLDWKALSLGETGDSFLDSFAISSFDKEKLDINSSSYSRDFYFFYRIKDVVKSTYLQEKTDEFFIQLLAKLKEEDKERHSNFSKGLFFETDKRYSAISWLKGRYAYWEKKLGESKRIPQIDDSILSFSEDLKYLQVVDDVSIAPIIAKHFSNRYLFVDDAKWYMLDNYCWEEDKFSNNLSSFRKDIHKAIFNASLKLEIEDLEKNAIDEKYKSKWTKIKTKICNGKFLESLVKACQHEDEFKYSSSLFNQEEYYFGAGNGVVDLRTGELLQRDLKVTRSSTTNYIERPEQLDAVEDLFYDITYKIAESKIEGADSFREMLKVAFGYFLVNGNPERLFYLFYGESTTGKSYLFSLLRSVMDKCCATLDPSFLYKKNSGFSSGRNEEFSNLIWTRFLQFNEGDTEYVDEAKLKLMTSCSDGLYSRGAYTKEGIVFKPKFKPALLCNKRPEIIGNDDAVWRRVFVIPFKTSFADGTKTPSGRTIGRDLEHEREQPAFKEALLYVLVQGAVSYYNGAKFRHHPIPVSETTSYRLDQDILIPFFNERLIRAIPRQENMDGPFYNSKDYYVKFSTIVKEWKKEKHIDGFDKIKDKDIEKRLLALGYSIGKTSRGKVKVVLGVRIRDSFRESEVSVSQDEYIKYYSRWNGEIIKCQE